MRERLSGEIWMAFLGDGEKMWTWRGRKDKMGGNKVLEKNLKK